MQITVHCPKCHECYHLNAEMVGQRTRCTNAVCREIFVVQDGVQAAAPPARPQPPAPPPPARRQTGMVGDIIPVLSAEAAEPAAALPEAEIIELPKPAPAAPSWQQAPPVRRPPTRIEPPAPTKIEPATKVEPPAKVETPPVPDWKAAPPPPRRQVEAPARKAPETVKISPSQTIKVPAAASGDGIPAIPTSPDGDGRGLGGGPVEYPDVIPQPVSRRLLPKVMMAGAAVVGLVAIAGFFVFRGLSQSEEAQFRAAHKLLEDQKFASAEEKFHQLAADFSGDNADKYHFFEELCGGLDGVHRSINPEIPGAFERLLDFHKAHEKDPLLKEKAQKEALGKAFYKSVEDITEKAEQGLDANLLDKARDALRWTADHFRPEVGGDKITQARERLNKVKTHIAQEQLYRDTVNVIEAEAAKPSDAALDRIDDLIRTRRAELPRKLDDDPRVIGARKKVFDALRGRVVWKDGRGAMLPTIKGTTEEADPSLLVVPAVLRSGAPAPDNPRVFFALARGVLYALEQSTGGILWATRVGVDTSSLPVRLPAREIAREVALVLSSDTLTLTARDAKDGTANWSYPLKSPCLGRPVIVDRLAYVPTFDGKVHVIGITEGKLIGWYELGQALTMGGVHQEGTSHLFFPADQRSIFVLDTAQREKQPCTAIIPSGHPSGSLRSEPVIISREELRKFKRPADPADWPDLLILNQADGLNDTRARVFPLTPQGGAGPPLPNEPRVPGWSWFPPFHDNEQLIQVTDAGVLGVVGIKQFGNPLDRDLFLETRGGVSPKEGAAQARAQVVHAVDNDLWALAHGELHYLHFNRFGAAGRQLVPLWPEPLPLGSPLHASQVDGNSLFLVTQALTRPTCFATCVDAGANADKALVRWKRQLGFLAKGEPLAVGKDVVALDVSGALFLFDPKRHRRDADYEWQQGGQLLNGPLDEGMDQVYLLPSRDGGSAFAVASGPGKPIVIRRYTPGRPLEPRSLGQYAPLAGLPGVGDDGLLLPLADGDLLQVPFDPAKLPAKGPHWRARDAEPGAPGYVVHLGGSRFLMTDGSRRLVRGDWPRDGEWRRVNSFDDLPGTIIAAPVVLPAANADEPLRVCVADARNHLTLLAEETLMGKKTWVRKRSWPLGGRVTAGPFLRGPHVYGVVNQERLVCIDPDQEKPVWEYAGQDGGIVGVPQEVEGVLLVAHRTGRFVGLDPRTGEPQGKGYALKARSVAPAASPVPFGDGRAFAPLTDGTVLLLATKRVHPAKK